MTSPERDRRPRRRSPLAVVFLAVFIDLVGFGIVIPLFPLYAERYQPSPMAFGLLMASFSAMQFLFAPLLGRLSDRVGRRPVLLVSLAGSAAGYLLFAFARSLTLLFVSRLVAGATAANIGTAQAVVADVTEREQRARGMGLIGMAFGLGFVLGPAIGGFAVKAGEAVPGLVAAALSATAFVWALLELPETRPPGPPQGPTRSLFPVASLAAAARRPAVGALLVLTFVATTAFANLEATFAQFVAGRFSAGPSTVAWLFVVLGVTGAAVQGGLLKRLVPRLGEQRLVAVGTGLIALSFVALLLVRSLWALVAVLVVVACGNGILNPSLASLLSRSAASREQGEVLGAGQSLSSLGRIVGPFWGENVYLRYGAIGPYGTGLVLEVVAFLVAVFALSRPAAEPARTELDRAPGGS